MQKRFDIFEQPGYLVLAALLVVFLIVGLACFTGCVSEQNAYESEFSDVVSDDNNRFASVETSIDSPYIEDSYIFVDKETGIEYLYLFKKKGYGGGPAVTMLYNEDGTPKINENYKAEHND